VGIRQRGFQTQVTGSVVGWVNSDMTDVYEREGQHALKGGVSACFGDVGYRQAGSLNDYIPMAYFATSPRDISWTLEWVVQPTCTWDRGQGSPSLH